MIFFYTVTIEINFSIYNSPPAKTVFRYSCIIEIYSTTADVPPAIGILFYAVAVKINFSIYNTPPAVYIFIHTGMLKINFSTANVPPAVFTFHNIIAAKIDFSIYNTPRTIFIAFYTCVTKIYLTVFYIPPAILVFSNICIGAVNQAIMIVIPVVIFHILDNTIHHICCNCTGCRYLFLRIPCSNNSCTILQRCDHTSLLIYRDDTCIRRFPDQILIGSIFRSDCCI